MINAVNSKSFSSKDLLIVDITDEKIRSYSTKMGQATLNTTLNKQKTH
jgi:CHASE2 domain-containing sensor protein